MADVTLHDRAAAASGGPRGLRGPGSLRRAAALLSCALLAACASDEALQTGLDDRGRSWVSLESAVTLARPAPRFSNAARDYLYVAPVQASTSGTRRHYLWVGLGTTVDRGWPWAAPSDATTLLLTVDGVPLTLPLAEWDAPEGAELYRTPAPVYQVRRASVSLDALQRIMAASEVQAQVVASDGSVARYDLWDGQWSDWTAFVVGLEPALSDRAVNAAR
jgi:hypothetical protein